LIDVLFFVLGDVSSCISYCGCDMRLLYYVDSTYIITTPGCHMSTSGRA